MRKNRIIDKNWSIENIKYGKYKSNVPGDITNDLYLAGRIDDPLFGVNFKDSRWILESHGIIPFLSAWTSATSIFLTRSLFLTV